MMVANYDERVMFMDVWNLTLNNHKSPDKLRSTKEYVAYAKLF